MIYPKGDHSTECEILLAVTAFLETCAYGEAPFVGDRGLFFNVPRFIKLTAIDRQVSNSRAAELKYHLIVRNCYRTGERLGILARRRGGGYQLTSHAKQRVRSNSATVHSDTAADTTAAIILRHYLGHSVPNIGVNDARQSLQKPADPIADRNRVTSGAPQIEGKARVK